MNKFDATQLAAPERVVGVMDAIHSRRSIGSYVGGSKEADITKGAQDTRSSVAN